MPDWETMAWKTKLALMGGPAVARTSRRAVGGFLAALALLAAAPAWAQTLSLSLSSDTISEGGGVATVTASLTSAVGFPLTVTVGAEPNVDTVAGDFTLTGTKLTIAGGNTASTGTVTITAVNNNEVQTQSKTVAVWGAVSSDGALVANPSDVTLTITDNDGTLPTGDGTTWRNPLVVSSAANWDVRTESLPAKTTEQSLAVTVHSGRFTLSDPIISIWACVTRTVSQSGDYDAPGPARSICRKLPQLSSTSTTVPITLTQAEIDNDGVVIVVEEEADNGVQYLYAEWVPIVLVPKATLALSPASISESGGVATVTATLDKAAAAQAALTVAAAPGAGAAASDFNLSGTPVLTFAAGATASTGTVTITAVDNTTDSPDKRVRVSGQAGDLNVPGAVTLTLADDEPTPTLSLSLSPGSIREDGGVATVTAALSGTSSEAVTVTVAASPGAGAVTGDYTLTGTKLTIVAGATASTGTVTITGVDNLVSAGTKQVTVTGAAAGGVGVAAPSSMTLRITDNEALPEVALLLSENSISEDGGRATVTATLSGASGGAVTVTVSAAPGTGASAGDYTQTGTKLTIAAGSTASTGTVTITAVDDDTDSPNKQVSVSGQADGDVRAQPGAVTLTLTDDEATPTLSLSLAPDSISEAGGVATVTSALSGASSEAVTVTVSASPGAGTDFTLAGTKLTIAAGNTASTGTVTITAVDDHVETADKQVTVSVIVAGGLGVVAPSSETLTITDNDALPTGAGRTWREAGIAGNHWNVDTEVLPAREGAAQSLAVTVNTDGFGGNPINIWACVTRTVAQSTAYPAPAPDQSICTSLGQLSRTSTTVSITLTRAMIDNDGVVIVMESDVSDEGEYLYAEWVSIVELPTATLALSPSSISETGGVATVTATLDEAAPVAATVTVAVAPGAGAVASDVTLSGTPELVFAAGATTSTGTVTITAVGNTIDSPDKRMSVSGQSSNVEVSGAVELTLTDDDDTPTATLLLSAPSIDESGASNAATVTARLGHGSSEPVTVTVTLAPVSSTGAVAGDYTLSSTNTLTIAAGDTTSSGTVTVTAVDNPADEPDVQVTVSGASVGGRGVAAPNDVTLTIADDEAAPGVTLSLSDPSIAEAGGTSTVSAALSHPSSAGTTVTVAAVSGAYTVGADVTIVIAAGDTVNAADTVTITAADDDVDNVGDRAVTVTGTAANDQADAESQTVAVTGAALTLEDDEATPTATLALGPSKIDEHDGTNPGSSTVTATLDRVSSEEVVLTVEAAEGANAATGDFALSGEKTLTIAAGSTVSTGVVTVAAVDNTKDEPDKEVKVSATVGGNSGVSAPANVTLTIEDDDDVPSVSISSPSVAEGASGSTASLGFEVALGAASGKQVTVAYAEGTGGTATAGTDYTALSAETLTFAADETAKTVTVSVTGDGTDEPDETVVVVLSTPVNATLGTATGTGTITDDDAAPGVALSLSDPSIIENGGTSEVSATLSHPSVAATTVTVTAVPGAYTVGADVTIVIAAGDTANAADTVTIAAVDDAIANVGDRTVTVTGTAANDQAAAESQTVAVTGAALTLEDDEAAPTATLALSPSTIDEHDGTNPGSSTVTATLNRVSSAEVVLTVVAAAGANTATGDFSLSGAKTLTIAAGQTASTGTVTVAAVDNAKDEPDKSVTVSATVGGSSGVAAPASLTLTIEDDDAAPDVTLSLSAASITENGGTSAVSAALSHPSSAATTVTVTPAAGFYTVGADATIVIAAGDTVNATDTATVSAVDDDVHQGAGGRQATVTATVDNDHDQGAGSVAGASLALTDDETLPTASLALAPESITETGGVSSVTATLSGKSSEAVVVTVAATAGAGAVAADFTLTGTKLTIAAGSTASAGDVTVTANGNTVDSPDKSVTVSGTVAGGNGVAAPPDMTLTLTDDDALPTATLLLSASSIVESGASNVTTVTARLDHGSSEPVTITVSLSPVGSTGAVAGDYTLSATTTLTIAAGGTASTGLVTVTAVDNTADEANAEVTVSGAADGGRGVADPAAKTLTIRDDDGSPFVTLLLSAAAIDESGASNVTTVTARLNRASGAVTTVTVAAAPGAGAVAANFRLSTAKTLTIAAGQTTSTGTVTVAAVDDDTDAPDRSVTISGTAANSQGIDQPSDVTLTIRDDDTATLSLLLSDPVSGQPDTIKELATAPPAERMTTVTARLSTPASAAVTITVSATAGTNAVAGNYTLSTAKTLTIAAGVTTSTGTVTITAVDDRIDSIVDDTVAGKKVVVKGAPSGTLALAAPADVELLIWEDDRAALVTDPAFPRCRRAPCPVWLSVAEGASGTFTVKLNSEPTTNVTVAVKSDESDEGLVSSGAGTAAASTRLAFTATNWETAQTVTLHGVVDNVVDGDDDYTLRLFPDTPDTPTDAYHVIGGASVRPQTVRTTDVDVAGLTVSGSTLTVTEGGTEQTFTVKLTSKPAAAVTVTATSADGDEVRVARNAGDADARAFAASKELVFTANDWNDAQTLRVAAVDDDRDDPASLPVAITLDTASGGDSHYDGLDDETVDVTKNDDDATPTLTLALSSSSISEQGGETTVTATLSGGKSGEAVTVTVAASPGTGAVAADFALSTAKTLTIAAGSTASVGTVTVTANPNDVDSPDKQVTISATVAGGHGLLSNPSSLTLTLTDDETLPTVTLALSDGSISEQAGETTVTATLSGKSSQAVTVTVAASPGTGAVAADFDLSAAKTLTIAAGATASAGTVTVTANGNDVDAPNKEVTVSATVAGGNGVAAPSDVTLTLTDDETLPTVTLALSDGSISEQGGETTVTATLSGKSSEAVTVTVGAAPGAGAVAADFDLSPAKTLTIAAGSTASAGTVTVTANGNDVHSGNKPVTISGTAVGGNGVAAPSDVTLTLTDDETLPTVTLALSPTSITETGGVSSVTATLSGKSSEAVVVTVGAAAGTGAVAADFTLTGTKLTIAAGSTASAGDVTVTANGNPVDSPDKPVTVSGTVAGGNGVANPDNVTLTLEDDDVLPTATLLLSAAAIDESGASNVTTVTARLDHGSSEAVTITVSLSPVGSAVAGDYTLSSPSTLTIAAGATASTGLVTVTAVDNTADEPDIQVTVSGAATGGRGVADPTARTLTIRDDDGPPLVTLLLSAPAIDESGASNVTTVTARLNRASGAATTVTVAAAPGAGAVAGNFRLSTVNTLTIAAGNTTSTGTVTVTAEDDDTDAPDRSVTISGTAANTQGITQPSTRTLTIRDDDAAPDATLTVASSPILEDGGSTTVNATLSRPSSAATTVTVTAQADVYEVAAGAGATVVIAAGQTANAADTATITAVNNDVDAADNVVTVEGTATNSQAAAESETVSVTGAPLTITDDDTAGLAVSPATSTSSRLQTTEEGGMATFTVALVTEPTADVELDLASSDATEGAVSPLSLTFTATNWNNAQTVTLTGQDDADTDGNVDYTVTLTVDQANTADSVYDALGPPPAAAATVYARNADDDASPDVNENGTVDRDDALVLFYVYDFGQDLKDSASLREAALGPRRGELPENDASYLRMIANAEDWQAAGASGGGDLNASGSVDRDDALVMFYVYDFGQDLKDSASLREAALRPRAGRLVENDSSYQQMITAAERLAGATP